MVFKNGSSNQVISPQQQYRMIHDIYVLLQDGDSRVLRKFDLTSSQYGLLMLLDLEKGQRLVDLSERLMLARSTITRIVDQLEKRDFVRRVPDPEDRRAQRVILTELGAERREEAHVAHEESLQRRLSMLSDDERRQLSGLLSKMRLALHADLSSIS